jgi:hypothetical protein
LEAARKKNQIKYKGKPQYKSRILDRNIKSKKSME